MRKYEAMFIIQPAATEEALTAFVERLQAIVTEKGGEVIKAEPLGLHRLAYTIGRHQQGHYVLLQANLDQQTLLELERTLKLSEDVLRYLITRPPETE